MRVVLTLVLFGALLAQSASAADVDAGKKKSSTCAACHGPQGNSSNPQWPKLAGQHEQYLYGQLKAFKQGQRSNAVMSAQVANLSDADMKNLAAYYASQTMAPGAAKEAQVNLGERIYRGGKPGSGVPACKACHGPAGRGNPAAAFPRLSFQQAPYVVNQLQAYRAGERTSDPAKMMRTIASGLTDAEIEAVAQYVSGLHE